MPPSSTRLNYASKIPINMPPLSARCASYNKCLCVPFSTISISKSSRSWTGQNRLRFRILRRSTQGRHEDCVLQSKGSLFLAELRGIFQGLHRHRQRTPFSISRQRLPAFRQHCPSELPKDIRMFDSRQALYPPSYCTNAFRSQQSFGLRH